eukprot:TRINITY_DN1694_c5_g1_i1.p1 TRINITY_DN1694_c5_g1~~TRINITY_DN1694_c5_g1_i1.p1  ORF type:complete len:246 (-),score=54.98 TRINITY_DN1694_c5_g1_i1:38-775(-)
MWIAAAVFAFLLQSLQPQLVLASGRKWDPGDTNEVGKKFLADYIQQEGVISTTSGINYRVLRTGSGTESPIDKARCLIHWEVRTAQNYPDGEKMDSTYDRSEPMVLQPNMLVPGQGMSFALQMMVEGDKWEVALPAELGYGAAGSTGKVAPGDALFFTIELLEIKGESVPAMRCDDVKDLKDCNDDAKKYVKKQREKEGSALQAELERLSGMTGNAVKPDKQQWLHRRIKILKSLVQEKATNAEL